MRSMYRFIRGGKNAPNLWFGMPPRFLNTRDSKDDSNNQPIPPQVSNDFLDPLNFPPPPAPEEYFPVDEPPRPVWTLGTAITRPF
jgi:hypothetical protein